EFLHAAPRGHEQGRATIGRVPSYHFWMRVRHAPDDRLAPPPLVIAGGIGLRIGMNHELEMYSGHLGYHVYPASRGNHYAERACRLLLPLARRHGIAPVWITCNPDNAASRRTCERLGAEFVETVRVPDSHEFFHRGERHKCRYRICL
ncbi:MAG: GNAT family N-acetyltransferase, partial [Tepidisphaeraceae bacterium]